MIYAMARRSPSVTKAPQPRQSHGGQGWALTQWLFLEVSHGQSSLRGGCDFRGEYEVG